MKPLRGRVVENLAIAGGDIEAFNYSGKHNDPTSWGYPHADDGVDMVLASWVRELAPYQVGDHLYVREAFMPAPEESPAKVARPTLWTICYGADAGQARLTAPAGYNPMLYNYERYSPACTCPNGPLASGSR